MKNVKYFLVNAVGLGSKTIDLFPEKRENLVEIPRIMQYENIHLGNDNSQIYVNSLNSYLIIDFVGEYKNQEKAIEAYNQNFNTDYKKSLNLFNKTIEVISDFDTSMQLLVIEDSSVNEVNIKVEYGRVKLYTNSNIKGLLHLDKELKMYYRTFLDACLIYLTCEKLDKFLKNLTTTKNINNEIQNLLAIYSQELFKLSKPQFYLTYQPEIRIMELFYKSWKIEGYINKVKSNFNQSVSNYSFLWNYRNQVSQKRMNTYLLCLTVLTAYTPIMEILKQFGLTSLTTEVTILILVTIILIIFKPLFVFITLMIKTLYFKLSFFYINNLFHSAKHRKIYKVKLWRKIINSLGSKKNNKIEM